MKIFCALLVTLAAVCSAEPPVDRYLPPGQNTPSSEYTAPSDVPSQYGAPGAPSSEYGVPSAPSNQYGAPNAPSNQYGAPSAPSNQYGAPSTPSNKYGAPSGGQTQAVFRPSQNYGAPKPSQNYGAPKPSQNYGAPKPSQNYGAPKPSQNYGAPKPSQNYGAPKPSQNYGAPRPSQSYGAPSNEYLPANQGYGGKGNGEDQYNEPANYNFEYMVKDEQSGNDFGHKESRQGDRAEGEYYVLLPDGRKQIVTYEADEQGYRPKIRYEDSAAGYGRGPANGGHSGSNGGY